MNQQTVDISCVSDKAVIERLPRRIWPQYRQYGQEWLKGLRNKSAKYENFGKCWLYCTQNRAITNALHCYYCSYHLTKPLNINCNPNGNVTHYYYYKYFLIIIGFFNINGKVKKKNLIKRWRASEEKFGKVKGTDEFG